MVFQLLFIADKTVHHSLEQSSFANAVTADENSYADRRSIGGNRGPRVAPVGSCLRDHRAVKRREPSRVPGFRRFRHFFALASFDGSPLAAEVHAHGSRDRDTCASAVGDGSIAASACNRMLKNGLIWDSCAWRAPLVGDAERAIKI
jgi:hypothetical protein